MSSLSVSIQDVTENALRDVNAMHAAGIPVSCLLIVGGAVLIDQQVYLDQTEIRYQMNRSIDLSFKAYALKG